MTSVTTGKVIPNIANNAELAFMRSGKWKTIVNQGRNVYKRNDQFDPYMMSTRRVGRNGPMITKRNVDWMKDGKPPHDKDELAVVLHHITQKHDGPLVELSTRSHRKFNDELHDNKGVVGAPSSDINRSQFDKEREEWWIYRALEFP